MSQLCMMTSSGFDLIASDPTCPVVQSVCDIAGFSNLPSLPVTPIATF